MNKIKIVYGCHGFNLVENNVKNSVKKVSEFNNREHVGQ